MKFGHTKAFLRKQEIISLQQEIKKLQEKLDRLIAKDKYYVEQDQKRLEEKRKQEALRQELNNNPKYEWFDERNLDNLYQTREELQQAECDPNEIGRIDWYNWERVVKETKEWIRQR